MRNLRNSGHIIGLDGMRALAVVAVVAFHLWPASVPGGFLGVSVFFSLSGYLITRNLLSEHSRRGTIQLRSFWARRARRLLPAAWVTLAVVVSAWGFAGWMTAATRNSATAAVAHVANWAQILSGVKYGAGSELSPLVHFWSLAIEEQFYLLYPLVAAVALRKRNGSRVLSISVMLGFSASVGFVLANSGNALVTYFSTFARAAELLAGALAALAHTSISKLRRSEDPSRGYAADIVAVAGLVMLVVLSAATSLDTEQYYQGGLILVGVLSAVTVSFAAGAPRVGNLLDNRVLHWIGTRSYGIYLAHWPAIVAAKQLDLHWSESISGDGTIKALAVLAFTLVVAELSFRFVETPIREKRPVLRRPKLAAAAALAGVSALIAVSPVGASVKTVDFEQVVADAGGTSSNAMAGIAAPVPTVAVASAPVPANTAAVAVTSQAPGTTAAQVVSYGLFGDSKALTLAIGGAKWYQDPALRFGTSWANLGCPLTRLGRTRSFAREGDGTDTAGKCDWEIQWSAVFGDTGPVDVAVMWYGTWDVAQRNIPEIGCEWCSIGTAAYDKYLLDEMTAATDWLHAQGVKKVAWMTIVSDNHTTSQEKADSYNHTLEKLAVLRPEVAEVIDIAGWLEARGVESYLPDRIHPTFDDGVTSTAYALMAEFIGTEVLRVAAS